MDGKRSVLKAYLVVCILGGEIYSDENYQKGVRKRTSQKEVQKQMLDN
jgi:hypothetical protein